MRTLTFLAAITLASPALASLDRLPITPDTATEFTVGFKARATPSHYWCAAARYVTNTLGLPEDTRLYRLSPPPRKAGQGITFTLLPEKSAGDTGVSTYGGPQDGGFEVGSAQAILCNSFRTVGD